MNEYLEARPAHGLVQLVDCRHEPTLTARCSSGWRRRAALPVVLTKSDKLPRGQRQQALARARQTLGFAAAQPIQLFSAEDGTGRAELIAWIDGQLTAWRPAAPAGGPAG
jgi:GTP-binding protein